MGSITERRVQSAHTPRSLALPLSLDPYTLPSPPPCARPCPFFTPCTQRGRSCLFLFLGCLSARSTLMHLLAYRYNCRAIIKAGLLSFFLTEDASLSLSLPLSTSSFSLLFSLPTPAARSR